MSESTRWYTQDGTAVAGVPYKDKKRAGELRAATIKDARAYDYLPSVTTLIGQLAKPGLDVWKTTQAIHAALTTPDLSAYAAGDLTEEAFIKKIMDDSKEQATKAAEEGGRFHLAVLKRLQNQDYDEDLTDFVVAVYRRLCDLAPIDSWHCELPFSHMLTDTMGYGGTRDLVSFAADTLIDIKTQDFDDIKQVKVYPEWAIQLAGYEKGLDEGLRINLVASRTQPGLLVEKVWSAEEMEKARAQFHHLLNLWWATNMPERYFGREEAA